MRPKSWLLLCTTLLAGCVGAFEPSEETTTTDHTLAPLASTSASTTGDPPATEGSVAPPQVTTPPSLPERKLDRPPPHPALPDPAAEEPIDNSAATIRR